jgi:hypothetical protein
MAEPYQIGAVHGGIEVDNPLQKLLGIGVYLKRNDFPTAGLRIQSGSAPEYRFVIVQSEFPIKVLKNGSVLPCLKLVAYQWRSTFDQRPNVAEIDDLLEGEVGNSPTSGLTEVEDEVGYSPAIKAVGPIPRIHDTFLDLKRVFAKRFERVPTPTDARDR